MTLKSKIGIYRLVKHLRCDASSTCGDIMFEIFGNNMDDRKSSLSQDLTFFKFMAFIFPEIDGFIMPTTFTSMSDNPFPGEMTLTTQGANKLTVNSDKYLADKWTR